MKEGGFLLLLLSPLVARHQEGMSVEKGEEEEMKKKKNSTKFAPRLLLLYRIAEKKNRFKQRVLLLFLLRLM